MSIFCQFSSLTSSIYWQIQYKTKKLNTNISWKPYVRFPSNKNYIDQCTQSDMINLFKWSYSQFLFSWNIISNLLNINHFFHLKCYILIQTPSQSDIWLQRYVQFFEDQKQYQTYEFEPVSQNQYSRHPTHRVQKQWHHKKLFCISAFWIPCIGGTWRKNIHSPNLTWIGSRGVRDMAAWIPN